MPGQTVAGLVSFFAVIMVWTGLALSLRRFLRFLSRIRGSSGKSASARTVLVKSTS